MRAFALGFALGVVLTATVGITLLRHGIGIGLVMPSAVPVSASDAEMEAAPAVPVISDPPGAPPEPETALDEAPEAQSPAGSPGKAEKEEKVSLLTRLKRLFSRKSSNKSSGPALGGSGPGEALALAGYSPAALDPSGGDYHIWDGRLFVEASNGRSSGGWDLFCFDLETGEQLFTLPMDDGQGMRSELRRNFDKSGGFYIFTADQRLEYDQNGDLLSTFTLPDSVRMNGDGPIENPYQNIYGVRWDVLPEKDLLIWCDTEGVWRGDLEGNVAEKLADDHYFDFEDYNFISSDVPLHKLSKYDGLGPWEYPLFRTVRIMQGGETVSAEFGSPIDQTKHRETVTLLFNDTRTEEERWRDKEEMRERGYTGGYYSNVHYFVGYPGSDDTDYPDEHTVYTGYTMQDLTTGLYTSAPRWDYAAGYPAVMGDLSEYYGVETTDTYFNLYRYDIADRDGAELLLSLPRQQGEEPEEGYYQEVTPLAAKGDQVICGYSMAGETGLMLVTAAGE